METVATFRLTDGVDPEERLEEAALWKAMYDAFGGAIAVAAPDDAALSALKAYGRTRRSDYTPPLAYWNDPAFLKESRRAFRLCAMEDVAQVVGEMRARGLGAFIKSTKDKHAIFRVPVGSDPREVIGDFAYSFIDGGPMLMVQDLCEITYEWRFFCVGRRIVTHSPNAAHLTPLDFMRTGGAYRTPADKAPSAPIGTLAGRLLPVAERIAAAMLTEDAVIDCALINGEPGCVELNPLIVGGVGLFACDVRRLAVAVRDRDFPALHIPAENSAPLAAAEQRASAPPEPADQNPHPPILAREEP